jgi:hypothetical protein
MWLAHWQGWKISGVSMAEYARREGFDVDAAYRWKRVLRRAGQWAEGVTCRFLSDQISLKKWLLLG